MYSYSLKRKDKISESKQLVCGGTTIESRGTMVSKRAPSPQNAYNLLLKDFHAAIRYNDLYS